MRSPGLRVLLRQSVAVHIDQMHADDAGSRNPNRLGVFVNAGDQGNEQLHPDDEGTLLFAYAA